MTGHFWETWQSLGILLAINLPAYGNSVVNLIKLLFTFNFPEKQVITSSHVNHL